MHIKQTHNAVTRPNLLKEHANAFPTQEKNVDDEARKPNNVYKK